MKGSLGLSVAFAESGRFGRGENAVPEALSCLAENDFPQKFEEVGPPSQICLQCASPEAGWRVFMEARGVSNFWKARNPVCMPGMPLLPTSVAKMSVHKYYENQV